MQSWVERKFGLLMREVNGVEQLYKVMDRISSVQGVFEVQRDTGGIFDGKAG